MAVVTPVERADLEAALAPFGVGRVLSHRGLAAGSINTNIEVVTEAGRFFARVFEGKSPADVAYELDLIAHVAARGVPVPAPRVTAGGERTVALRLSVPAPAPAPAGAGGNAARAKPLALFDWADGEHVPGDGEAPLGAARARALGDVLARLHLAASDFARRREGAYGLAAMAARLPAVRAAAGAGDAALGAALPLLDDERAWLESALAAGPALPAGVLHGDLFPDNVVWQGARVAALLDFEMAQDGPLVRDLATVLLAWCWGPGELGAPAAAGPLRADDARAVVAGYAAVRPLEREEGERGLWTWARFVAWRYALSRITDFHLSPLAPERLLRKDFRAYVARLQALRAVGPGDLASALGIT